MRTAFVHAQRAVREVDSATRFSLVVDQGRLAIATFIEFNRAYDLYFLPVASFYTLLIENKRPAEIELLSSVLNYVHTILWVDFFTEEDSYLYYQFTMLRDSELFEEAEDRLEFIVQINDALKKGEIVRRHIVDERHFLFFGERVEQFSPDGDASEALLSLATSALALYSKFGRRGLKDSIHPEVVFAQHDDNSLGERMWYHQYLSFTWEIDGPLADEVLEYVNMDLQECINSDNPISVQVFDRPQACKTLGLDFEKAVFELLEMLSDYLTNTLWKMLPQ